MALRTVLCEKDTFAGTICNQCKKKLESNQITQLDADMSHKLGKLAKTFPVMNAEFKKALDLQEFVVLVCTGNIGSVIGSKGKIISEITKQMGKKARVIEFTKNEKKMVQDLIGSARIISFKKKFSPNKKEYTITIPKQDREKLIAPKETLQQALKSLLKSESVIEFG